MNTQDFIQLANSIHNKKFLYSKVNYVNNYTKIIIECPIHGDFLQSPKNHLYKKTGCPKCSLILKHDSMKTSLNDFIEKANQVHSKFYGYDKVNYVSTHKKVIMICPIHGDFMQAPCHHLNGSGCPKCSGKYKTTQEFIDQAHKIHGNKYSYDQTKYLSSKDKTKIKCKIHGVFLQSPQHHLNGSGCPNCQNSKGENIISNYLIIKNIDYERNKKFNDCANKKKLSFDFYLINQNILIEYNGIQHYQPIKIFGGLIQLKKQKENDLIKQKFCKQNNIKLLKITYKDNIIKKLNKTIMK